MVHLRFHLLHQQYPLHQCLPCQTSPGRYSLVRTCICWPIHSSGKGKGDHSLSHSPDHLHIKRTHVTSPEVEIRGEHSSIQGDIHMPNSTPEIGADSRWQRQESSSSSSSPTRCPADPDYEVVTGSSRSTEDQASSDLSLSKGNVDDSNLDMASGDCLSCSETDDVSMWPAWKKYRKRVRASCKLSKGTDWMETEMKRIRESHQNIWSHDHKIVRTEWKCALVEDCTSFENKGNGNKDWPAGLDSQSLWLQDLYQGIRGGGLVAWQRPWSCPWNSFMPISTGSTRRRPPGQWWTSKAYTLATPYGIQTYQPVWAICCFAHGVLSSGGTQKQLLLTSERWTTD